MFKYIYIIFVSCALFSFTADDSGKSKALSANAIKFYGINFSKMKCIHKADFVDKIGNTQCESLVARYFTEWNEMFITEKDKFDPKRYFQVTTVDIDLTKSLADVPNYSITDCVIEDDNYTISAESIQAIAKQYQNASDKGVGVVLIAESLNKLKEKGTFYAVYFDIASGDYLYSMKASGAPVGYGFSSYWINALNAAFNANAANVKKERKNLGIIPKNNW